jgi:hypothetical protein
MADVIEATHVRGYVIHVRFDDGATGDVDLAAELWGPMFEPLREPTKFIEFRVDPELGTIAWRNGADIAAEFLYEQITGGAMFLSEHGAPAK